MVTGYSLGGSLTEMVCSSPEAKKHGNTRGFSFNGYGADGNLSACGEGFRDRGNVICIYSSSDVLVGKASHHVGKEYVVPVNFGIADCHWIGTMDRCIQNLSVDNNIETNLFNPLYSRGSRIIAGTKTATSSL